MTKSPDETVQSDPDDLEVIIGPETEKFLDEKALESFKRQSDLDQSILGSLPLIFGGLVAAGAIISSIATSLPSFEFSEFTITAYVLFALVILPFGAALWWFWQVIKPRDFEYLPDDERVGDYADNLTRFHQKYGMTGEQSDTAVAAALRAFMREAYVKSAKSTFDHNQERLSARSQVVLYLLCCFLLAFVADALVTGHRLLYSSQESKVVTHGNETGQQQDATKAATS